MARKVALGRFKKIVRNAEERLVNDLLDYIDVFSQISGRGETTIVKAAVGTTALVRRLRKGESLSPKTYDKVVAYIDHELAEMRKRGEIL